MLRLVVLAWLLMTGSAFAGTVSDISVTFDDNVRNQRGLVLVEFMTDWCGVCRRYAPELGRTSNSTAVPIYALNADKNKPVSSEFKIKAYPTLILFKNGKPIARHEGTMQKSTLLQFIKNEGRVVKSTPVLDVVDDADVDDDE